MEEVPWNGNMGYAGLPLVVPFVGSGVCEAAILVQEFQEMG